jgi:ATP-binding cassette subfamily B (MDR/TAP) protein 1
VFFLQFCRPLPKTFVPDSRPLSPRSSSAPFSLGKSYVRDFQASEQNVLESPPVLASPPVEKPALEAKAEDSFDTTFLQSLPRIDVHHHQQKSHYSNSNPSSTPESPISPLLNSDQDERSHSKTFSRSLSQAYDLHNTNPESSESEDSPPSLWRLAMLSTPEWFCALLGSIGACLLGSFNPLFALLLAQVAETYFYANKRIMWHEVSKWCLLVAGMGLATVLFNFLQHFYFGIMGEKMTERVRRLMFSGT